MIYWGQIRLDWRILGHIATYVISVLANVSCELEQIMTIYDLWARRVILSNVQTDSNLTLFHY